MSSKKKTKKAAAKSTAVAKTNDTDMTVWQPKEFEGNDLLPIEDNKAVATIEGIPDQLVGREHIDPDDLVLPAIALLHGTSTAVQDRLEGAQPGCFMHTGTEECLPEGSLRIILVHHHKGNALFPKDDNPAYEGLKTCIAPDGIEGNEYGLCESCRKCLDWDDETNTPPLGAETHHFVAMTSWGPAMLRFARSSYKSANKFISSWSLSRKNLFAHPVVVRVREGLKELKSGKSTKYFYMQMAWQTTEKVPDELQRAAFQLYTEVAKKHETGHLKSQGDTEDELFGSDDD